MPVKEENSGEPRVVYRDDSFYSAHPHVAALTADHWLMVFTRAPRRPIILHPPLDPAFQNMLMQTMDGGQSWSGPVAVPAQDWRGMECAGLTVLRSGRVLLNQWRFRWYPPGVESDPRDDAVAMSEDLERMLEDSRELDGAGGTASAQEFLPCRRGGGETWVHLSDDGGRTFCHSLIVDTGTFSGGYGMRGAIELPDGDILLPLSDVPHYARIFVVRSKDGGETWLAPEPVAEEPGRAFEEPAPLCLADGRTILMLRENHSRILHSVISDDGGRTWTRPRPTGIPEYPAHLFHLTDGRLLCLAGRRWPPFGAKAYFSHDRGETWDLKNPVVVRDDLANRDLGYPTGVLGGDQALNVFCYGQDSRGITGIDVNKVALSNRMTIRGDSI
jgi:hypothetical protein